MSTAIVIAKKTADVQQDVVLHSQFANRHGLIAGATGTGKTVTLKVLAESFSRIGVPVFLADAKGDVSSLAKAGSSSPKFDARIQELRYRKHSVCSISCGVLGFICRTRSSDSYHHF